MYEQINLQPEVEEIDRQPALRVLRYIAEEMKFPEHLTPTQFRGFLKEECVTEAIAWAVVTHGKEEAKDVLVVTDNTSSSVLQTVSEVARGFKNDWPLYQLMLHYTGADDESQYGLTFHLQPDFSLDTRVPFRGAYSTSDVIMMLRAGASNLADAIEGGPVTTPPADAMFEELPAAA